MTLSRQYVKLCDRHDFDDPAILEILRSILPERDPSVEIERKVWEFAMTARFLDDVGLLNETAQALSVGAGDERILYWLANRVGRVIATDIYGGGGFADAEADPSMLTDPASHAPFPYREDHLEVLWMDGRELAFPDGSFDVVFTLSSIEHFGTPQNIKRAAQEIGRVVKPGGYAIVATDCLVRLHPLDTAPVEFAKRVVSLGTRRRTATVTRRAKLAQMFTRGELQSQIVKPSGLQLVQRPDYSLSEDTWHNVTTMHLPEGRLVSSSGQKYPMILTQVSRSVFTSVCLIMQKPTASATPL